MNICVFAASSRRPAEEYFHEAQVLGRILAREGVAIRYGGGGVGLMGALADAALQAGGRVTGVIPRFMMELEWGHPRLTECIEVETMAERKERMMAGTDAVVALPGGIGTLEELLEVLTLKQLGLYLNPVILLDTRGYYRPLQAMLQHAIAEEFLGAHHAELWTFVARAEEVLPAIRSTPPWSRDARKSAQL